MNEEYVRERFGIRAGDGLQTRTWRHNLGMGFHCVLCGEEDYMDCVSTTLFDGGEELGDLCQTCIRVGPVEAAERVRRYCADHASNGADAEELYDLATDLARMDLARWSTLAEHATEYEHMRRERGACDSGVEQTGGLSDG